jgi:S-DNA-T family DNA segregation ATPase FtsK/SpoIIIE
MGGAEKLLGAGDMLYLSGDMPQPQRIQSPFISETELKKVVKYLISAGESIPPSEINLTQKEVESGGFFASSIEDEDDGEAHDDLYEEAREIVMKAGKASTSYLQRRLRVGYARAARIMDILEEKGVIGPADGAKPREVLEKGDGFGEEAPDENEDDFKSTETV